MNEKMNIEKKSGNHFHFCFALLIRNTKSKSFKIREEKVEFSLRSLKIEEENTLK